MQGGSRRGDRLTNADLAAAGALVAIGLALRWAAALKPLWLDEIWSVKLLPGVFSPLRILTAHAEVNHYLNTFYLSFVPPTSWWPAYRLHSLIAGAAAIPLAGLCARRLGRAEAWAAMALTAFSYPLIHYSSEARGYSLAVCFSLASVIFLRRWLAKENFRDAAAFWALASLGLLAHLGYVFVLAAAGFSAWLVLARRERRFLPLRSLITLGGVPVLVLAALCLGDVRFMPFVGAPPQTVADVGRGALSLLVGGPEAGALSWAAAAAAAALTLAGMAALAREDEGEAVFTALLIFILPLASVAVFRPRSPEIRYLLLAMAFALQLAAAGLVRLWRSSAAGRALAGAAAVLILAGGMTRTARLIEVGRGDALAALDFMSARTSGPQVSIGSDNDFRNGMVESFYAPLVQPPKQLVYYKQGTWPAAGVDWVVIHSFDLRGRPPRGLRVGGVDYAYSAEFPYSGLSGLTWVVYRNARAGSVNPE